MAQPNSTSYESDAFAGRVRLGPQNFNEYGQLASIGYFSGTIGLRPWEHDDLRLPIVGLSAADVLPDRIIQILGGEDKPTAALAKTTLQHMGIHHPERASLFAANAWRSGALYPKEPIHLPLKSVPTLTDIPGSVKSIIGHLLRGKNIQEIALLPELADQPVADILEDFKDSLGLRSNAAVLSFGMLALRRPKPKDPPPAPARPQSAPAVSVTQPLPPPSQPKISVKTRQTAESRKNLEHLPHPEVQVNKDNIAYFALGGMTVCFDIAGRLSAPRSLTKVVHAMLGLSIASNTRLHNNYPAQLSRTLDVAIADFELGLDGKLDDPALLSRLVKQGAIRFNGQPALKQPVDETEKEYLTRLCNGETVSEIAEALSQSKEAVINMLKRLEKTFGVSSENMLSLRSYAQGIVPAPTGYDTEEFCTTAAPPLPEKPQPAHFGPNLVFWAGGVFRIKARPLDIARPELQLLIQNCLDANSPRLIEATGNPESPQLIKKLLTKHRLPGNNTQITEALFERKWISVEEHIKPPSAKLYPQELKIIQALPTCANVREIVKALNYTHAQVEQILHGCYDIFGVHTIHGLLAKARLADIL